MHHLAVFTVLSGREELLYSKRDDQVNLLAQVLVAAEGDLQQDDVATDDVTAGRPAVHRTQVTPVLFQSG